MFTHRSREIPKRETSPVANAGPLGAQSLFAPRGPFLDQQPERNPMAKKVLPADKHVGARMRARRLILGITQTELGDACAITFQQIQKYEKGVNRIGSSRLAQIAASLEVPVAFFFEGLDQKALQSGDASELGLIDS